MINFRHPYAQCHRGRLNPLHSSSAGLTADCTLNSWSQNLVRA